MEPVKELEIRLKPDRLLLPYTHRCSLQLHQDGSGFLGCIEGAGLSGDEVADVFTAEGFESATLGGLVVGVSLALSVLESRVVVRMLHQIRMLERVGVDFQVVFHWGRWTLCPEIQPKRRLPLFLHSQYAELLIPEPPIAIQV